MLGFFTPRAGPTFGADAVLGLGGLVVLDPEDGPIPPRLVWARARPPMRIHVDIPFMAFPTSPKCIPMSANPSSRASDPELVGEVVEVLAHDIERTLRFGFAGTRTALPRPPDMAGA